MTMISIPMGNDPNWRKHYKEVKDLTSNKNIV